MGATIRETHIHNQQVRYLHDEVAQLEAALKDGDIAKAKTMAHRISELTEVFIDDEAFMEILGSGEHELQNKPEQINTHERPHL